MKIAILGVGSLGSLLGGYLSAVAPVVLVGSWPEQIEALQREGITVVTATGERRAYHPDVTSYDDLPFEQDIAIIAVKSHQTRRAAAAANNLLVKDGLALTLQNGAGNLELLDESCGPARSTAGVTTQGARLLETGLVLDSGAGRTVLGCRDSLSPMATDLLTGLAQLLNEAGLETQTMTSIDGLLWSKLAVNAAINPLTALLELPNGALLNHPGLIEIMSAAAREAEAVAAAQGVTLAGGDPVEEVIEVATRTSANNSSMLQDIQNGRPTEIDAICGFITDRGRALTVPTPVNEQLLALMRQKEAGNRNLLWPSQMTLSDFLHVAS